MKRTMIALAVSAITFGATMTTDAEACTRIAWKTKDHGVFVSRTFDWMESTQPTLEVRAAGQNYQGAEQGEEKKHHIVV